jgi:hypothetical protein
MARKILSYYQRYVAPPKPEPTQHWAHLLTNRMGILGLAIFVGLLVKFYDTSNLRGWLSMLIEPSPTASTATPAPRPRALNALRGTP